MWAAWGRLYLPADTEGHCVPRKPGHPREDVRQNEPFLCGWLYLPPHKTPLALDAAGPRQEANGCYSRCGQTGSPAPSLTGGPAAYPSRQPLRRRR